MTALNELFVEQLKDLYDAENRITEALPKLVKAADSRELSQAFEDHLEETRGHVSRLEEVFSIVGQEPARKACKGIQGILKEGEEALDKPGGPARDALLIAGAQRVEHYEIAGYGTARAWADELGLDDAVDLLDETLDEESAADEKLTKIAAGGILESGINEEAA